MYVFQYAMYAVWLFGVAIMISGVTLPVVVYDGVISRPGRAKDRGFIVIIGLIIMGFGDNPF